MSDPQPPPVPPSAEPLRLDYATPARRGTIARFFVYLTASFFIAMGAGAVLFGVIIIYGIDEEFAAAISAGFVSILIGVGVLISWQAAQQP